MSSVTQFRNRVLPFLGVLYLTGDAMEMNITCFHCIKCHISEGFMLLKLTTTFYTQLINIFKVCNVCLFVFFTLSLDV